MLTARGLEEGMFWGCRTRGMKGGHHEKAALGFTRHLHSFPIGMLTYEALIGRRLAVTGNCTFPQYSVRKSRKRRLRHQKQERCSRCWNLASASAGTEERECAFPTARASNLSASLQTFSKRPSPTLKEARQCGFHSLFPSYEDSSRKTDRPKAPTPQMQKVRYKGPSDSRVELC